MLTTCQIISRINIAASGGTILLVVFGNFLFNCQHISLGLVRYFDVCEHGRRTCPDRDVLALLDDIHQLVVVTLNRCFKRAYIVVKTCALDVVDDLVDNADKLVVVLCFRQSLDCYACVHFSFLLIISIK